MSSLSGLVPPTLQKEILGNKATSQSSKQYTGGRRPLVVPRPIRGQSRLIRIDRTRSKRGITYSNLKGVGCCRCATEEVKKGWSSKWKGLTTNLMLNVISDTNKTTRDLRVETHHDKEDDFVLNGILVRMYKRRTCPSLGPVTLRQKSQPVPIEYYKPTNKSTFS